VGFFIKIDKLNSFTNRDRQIRWLKFEITNFDRDIGSLFASLGLLLGLIFFGFKVFSV